MCKMPLARGKRPLLKLIFEADPLSEEEEDAAESGAFSWTHSEW